MIRYIKIRNFLSFKEETTISFESNFLSKKDNVFAVNKKTKLMKSKIIYGANASGKSTILQALSVIKETALEKGRINLIKSFVFDPETKNEPSYCEICFFIDTVEYTYSFLRTADRIYEESLIQGEKVLFKRMGQEIVDADPSFQSEIDKGLSKMASNYSLLSVLHERNGMLHDKPIGHFFEKIILVVNKKNISTTMKALLLDTNDTKKKILIDFLLLADITIDDIQVVEESIPEEIISKIDDEERREEFRKRKYSRIYLGRKGVDGQMVRLDLRRESEGTQALFGIIGPIIQTILDGGVLVIDEIETNLHILILYQLLAMIHSPSPYTYQFIFTTHSTELMDLKIFKPEQIEFVAKNAHFESSVYTLADFDKKVRTENNIKNMYKLGLFGATPDVQDFSTFLTDIQGM